MSSPPTGTVTFLFTDIEGSIRLAQAHPAEWERTCQRHHAILRATTEAHQGYVFQIIGDAFCVAFATAADAMRASVSAQRALQAEAWGDTPGAPQAIIVSAANAHDKTCAALLLDALVVPRPQTV
jgi:class 3 adenylate cyclase